MIFTVCHAIFPPNCTPIHVITYTCIVWLLASAVQDPYTGIVFCFVLIARARLKLHGVNFNSDQLGCGAGGRLDERALRNQWSKKKLPTSSISSHLKLNPFRQHNNRRGSVNSTSLPCFVINKLPDDLRQMT